MVVAFVTLLVDAVPNWAERMTGITTLLLMIWTFGVMLATGCLAYYGYQALGELETAVEELDESKRDRHVAVFAEFGRRWEGAEMTEALILATSYTPDSMRELFEDDGPLPEKEHPGRPGWLEREREKIILLRVPSYFEDAAIISQVGALEGTRFRENFGGIAVEQWVKWRPTVLMFQEGDPQSYCEFRRLAEEVEREDGARGAAAPSAS